MARLRPAGRPPARIALPASPAPHARVDQGGIKPQKMAGFDDATVPTSDGQLTKNF